ADHPRRRGHAAAVVTVLRALAPQRSRQPRSRPRAHDRRRRTHPRLLGDHLMTDSPTIHDVWNEHRSLILADIAARTVYSYERALVLYIDLPLGSEPDTTLTSLTVRIACNGWSGSESTKTDTLDLHNRIMRVCVEAGLIPVNPAHSLRLKLNRDAKAPARRALSLAELERFLAHVPDGPYRRACQAHDDPVSRLGQGAAPTPVDVDQDGRRFDICRAPSPDKHGRRVMGPTKSRRPRYDPTNPHRRHVLVTYKVGKAPTDL